MEHTIFLLDDDPSIRGLLTSLLQNEGYKVVDCEDAESARALIHEHSYSAFLIDIFLPDLNGMEFIKHIQDSGITAPIIIITGSSELNHAREAVRLKVFEYLVKPFKTNQFMQVIKTALLHFELQQQKLEIEEQKRLYQDELEQLVDQKVAELRDSEEKYRQLVEQSLVGVFVIQDSIFTYANAKFCDILGSEISEILQKRNLVDFAIDSDKTMVESNFNTLELGRKTASSFEFHARNQEGKDLILQVWAAAYQYLGELAIEGILIDVTEQHKARINEQKYELELLNEHKLAAIGQLAAGIAHNLNTPISIIQGNAELMRLKYPDDGDEIDKILRQTKKMGELINTTLQKGRKEQNLSPGLIDINEMLEEELEFLTADLYYKHHIEKDIVLDPGVPKIRGIYSDFSQSIMAFIQNAVDAMYKASVRKLTIRTQNIDQYLKLIVKDTGCGMDEEVKQHIFEPFFTTKKQNMAPGEEDGFPRGTGLGLSTAFNLLQKYNVQIDVTSKIDQGTEFQLLIPCPA